MYIISFDPHKVGIFIPILMPTAFMKMEGEYINQDLGIFVMLLDHYEGFTKMKLKNIWTKEMTYIDIQYLIFSP